MEKTNTRTAGIVKIVEKAVRIQGKRLRYQSPSANVSVQSVSQSRPINLKVKGKALLEEVLGMRYAGLR